MIEQMLIIARPAGMGARASVALTLIAKRFKSSTSITLEANGETGDARSVLDMIALGLACGTPVRVIADGEDEEEALEAVTAFLQSEISDEYINL
jgi:phosphocarrier protein